MADPTNGINFMAMLNPQFAATQQRLQLQQAMAQQMMQQGSEQPPDNQLANPGGMVIKNSPWAALSRAVEKGVGAYSANKAIGDQMEAAQKMGESAGLSNPSDPLSPRMDEIMLGMGDGGLGKAKYEARTAGIKARNAAQGDTVTDANGNIMPKSNFLSPQPSPVNNPTPAVQPSPAASSVVRADPTITDLSPSGQKALGDMYNTAPEKASQIPSAADGKPYIDTPKIYTPDPSGMAKFNHENNTTGVLDAKDKAESLNKENTAFSQSVSNFKNEGNQIDNLIDIYKNTQGGTLIAQHPEYANKLVSLGIISDPSQISNVAGIQAAMNSHILDTLRQVRDANTSIGGPTSRIMAGEINTMLEDGASVKDQPEAMFKILTNAKGLVDYNMDMAKGWDTLGGTGNRAANGYTMPLSDYTTKYALSHDIQDYKANAQKTVGPLKGMAGNNAQSPALPNGITPQDIQAEMARRAGRK